MDRKTLKIALIGHIDHGKSTLLGRLLLATNSLTKGKIAQIKKISKKLGKDTDLAFLTDQLEEEREGNLTIDTTQVFLKTAKHNYIFIDNPGHFQFIKNMLTGTTQAEAAILVIDINQGLMEQTRRHSEIIRMLGINKTIVVLNKMDLVNYSEQKFIQTESTAREFLKTLGINPDFIIPISAKNGLNIAKKSFKMRWYKGQHLLNILDSLKLNTQSEKKPLRLPIQDVLETAEEKIIIGKVISGIVRKGQEVIILPALKKTTLDSILIFKQPNRTKAKSGECIGLTLKDSLLAKRGDIIVENLNLPQLTYRIKGNILWMIEQPLTPGITLTLRCATQEIQCIVEKIKRKINSATLEISPLDKQELKQNEIGIVELKTKNILVAEKFNFIEELGRFILVQNNKVCACGIITDIL
ncbi:MAG: GTP-binding protein [Candidatus Omnitrophica bacterium]|nr:GTP-binding protein [Candidatus Omnitrophota bacterium]